jgi:hypothetical protein
MTNRISHLFPLAGLLATLAIPLQSVLADSPTQQMPAVQKLGPAARPAAASGKDTHPAIRTLPVRVLKTQVTPVGPAVIQGPVLANCAMGFNKTGETKNPQTTVLYNFECTTPVITCPNNPALPGVSLDVEIVSTNPEQTAKRIRYTCTYYHIEQ